MSRDYRDHARTADLAVAPLAGVSARFGRPCRVDRLFRLVQLPPAFPGQCPAGPPVAGRPSRRRGRSRPPGGRDAPAVAAPARGAAVARGGVGRRRPRGQRARRRPRPGAADAAPGRLRGHRAGLRRALRRTRPDDRAVPARAPALAAPAGGDRTLAARPAHRAGFAGRRTADDPSIAAGSDGGPAARPGAAGPDGRVGTVLRQAGLHHDAGVAPVAADGRADAVDARRAAAAGRGMARACARDA